MAVVSDNEAMRHMLDTVFNYVHVDLAEEGQEYWWAPTNNRDGWMVVWLMRDGRLETYHSYRYPPEVWGGVDTAV